MEPSRHDGLAQLHQRYYPELVRLAFALTGDWSLAEELAQEAFVRAWRSWGSIRRQQSAPAYLRATVVNLARTSLRQRLREIRAWRDVATPTSSRGHRQPGRAARTRQPPPPQTGLRRPALLPGSVRGRHRRSAGHLGGHGQEPDGPRAAAAAAVARRWQRALGAARTWQRRWPMTDDDQLTATTLRRALDREVAKHQLSPGAWPRLERRLRRQPRRRAAIAACVHGDRRGRGRGDAVPVGQPVGSVASHPPPQPGPHLVIGARTHGRAAPAPLRPVTGQCGSLARV